MRRIAVFARTPREGAVKTRLSPALPPALACALYRGMLADALAAAAALEGVERHLFWADDEAGAGVATGPGWRAHVQRGDDLGARLAAAFDRLLAPPAEGAVVIGADCPWLGSATLARAFEALATHDLVLGPTRDGGYYLVGLSRPRPALFEGIPWSTERVLDLTLERARAIGATAATLEPLEDLDTPEDLVRLVARVAGGGPPPGAGTCAALREMGLLPGERE